MDQEKRSPTDLLVEMGYEDVIVFDSPSYDDALIGVSIDNRAVYDFDKMVECLMADGITYDDAVEFIDYNTIRAIPYAGEFALIIFYPLVE